LTLDLTIRTTLLIALIRPYRLSLLKPGRLIKYLVQDKRSVLQFIRLNP
jgi:hypothetical protein